MASFSVLGSSHSKATYSNTSCRKFVSLYMQLRPTPRRVTKSDNAVLPSVLQRMARICATQQRQRHRRPRPDRGRTGHPARPLRRHRRRRRQDRRCARCGSRQVRRRRHRSGAAASAPGWCARCLRRRSDTCRPRRAFPRAHPGGIPRPARARKPGAWKPIDAAMAARQDPVEPVHEPPGVRPPAPVPVRERRRGGDAPKAPPASGKRTREAFRLRSNAMAPRIRMEASQAAAAFHERCGKPCWRNAVLPTSRPRISRHSFILPKKWAIPASR